jgi:hypothetical protein
MDLVPPPGQTPLGWEKDALAGADETGSSDLPNWTVWFALFRAGASDSCSFHVQIGMQLIVTSTICFSSISMRPSS